MKAKIAQFAVRMLTRLHNLCYNNISRFAIIAEGGIHPKHRLTNYHQFFIDNIAPSDNVLDVGCGNGSLTYDIARKAKGVTAIDLNEKNFEFARKNFNKENIKYISGDATKLDYKERYDVITLSNILEHIENRHDFLVKIRESGNKFLIRVPMVNRDWLTYYKKELGVEWRLDSTHEVEYTMESFQEGLEKAGLRIEKASIQFGEIWAVVAREK